MDEQTKQAEMDLNEQNQQETFEEAMEQLEDIVDKLEAGDVALEEAIKLFQKGMTLSQTCHQKLKKVEQQVQLLIEKDGEMEQQAFDIEEERS